MSLLAAIGRRLGARLQLARRLGVLRNKVAVATGRGGTLQPASEAFWRNAETTFLASPAYYDRREQVLRDVLPSLPRFDRVLDVGCGDGRFTCVLGAHARRVEGFDISPSLVASATARARAAGLADVEISVRELDDLQRDRRYDLVACMGVTSCLVEEDKYLRLLDGLVELVEPGGHLLLVDSVSPGKDRTAAYRNGYVARYRNQDAYLGQLTRRGLRLVRRELVQRLGAVDNQLYLFIRPALVASTDGGGAG